MWEFRDDRLWMTPPLTEDQNDPDLMVDFCERVETVRKRVNLLTGEEKLDIELYLPYDQKPIEMDRGSVVQSKVLPKLIHQGLTILDGTESAAAISRVLMETEADAPVHYTHDKLGFRTIRGKPCFLGHHPMGDLGLGPLSSTYVDPRVTEPHGSKKVWRKFLLRECVKSPPLALALALSVSAPVAHLLKEAGAMTEVPLFALVGESSKGKTTLLSLCAAVWANPAYIIHNFHATNSAFFAMLNGQNGIPFLADEATYVPNFDFDEVLYSLPTGKEKRRCTGSGELKPVVEFSGSIILTSEVSILERTQGFGGQEARVLEFSLKWMESGEQAKRVRETCFQNYGWGVEPIMALLLGEGFVKKLVRKYRAACRRLETSLARDINGVESRLIQRMALILVSGWAAQRAFKVHFHFENVERLLWETFRSATYKEVPKDSAEELLDLITSALVQNQSRFAEESIAAKKGKRYGSEDLWGMWSYHEGCRCVWILADIFQAIARKKKGMGLRTFCWKLEEAGYLLRTRPDGYQKKYPIGSVEPKCYCIRFPAAQTVLQDIEDIASGNRTMQSVAKALNRDPYGVSTAPVSNELMTKSSPRLALGFVSVGAQDMEIILNSVLAKALKLTVKDMLSFLPIPDKGLLLVSKRKLCQDCPTLRIRTSAGGLCVDNPGVPALAKFCNMNIERYQRLVFSDISIEERNSEEPVAIINYENNENTWSGDLCCDNPRVIDDLINRPRPPERKRQSPNREFLLNDGEEDDG